MAEYLEREALLRKIDDILSSTAPHGEEQIGVLKCRTAIRTIPGKHLVHGEWKVVFDGNGKLYENIFECSVCKTTHIGHPHVGRYCPNCGADMRGEEDDKL